MERTITLHHDIFYCLARTYGLFFRPHIVNPVVVNPASGIAALFFRIELLFPHILDLYSRPQGVLCIFQLDTYIGRQKFRKLQRWGLWAVGQWNENTHTKIFGS